jgi:hypothetical protein
VRRSHSSACSRIAAIFSRCTRRSIGTPG